MADTRPQGENSRSAVSRSAGRRCGQDPAVPAGHAETLLGRGHKEATCCRGESSHKTQVSIHVRLFLGSPCSLPHVPLFYCRALTPLPCRALTPIPSASPSPMEDDDTKQPRFPSPQRAPVPNIVIHQVRAEPFLSLNVDL